MLADAAAGRFPPIDGAFEVMAPARPGHCAIVEFTGHTIVLVEASHDALAALGADGFGGASHPYVKRFIAGANGSIGSHDAVLVTRGLGRRSGVRRESCDPEPCDGLEPCDDLDDHPRVVRSRHHRLDVAVYKNDIGLVTVGRGLVGRLEVSVELLTTGHGEGAGRRLIEAAVHLIPVGEAVWAQVAPGNAASLRAFLSCGFVPIGAETLIVS